MATASPTPLPTHGNGRITRHPSQRPIVRRDSPLSALTHSQGFSSGAAPLRNMDVANDSDDDDLQPPPVLSALGRSVLEQHHPSSPYRGHVRAGAKLRISRTNTPGKTAHDSITPAPSLRVKRVGLGGAPVRRARRTPQGEEKASPHYELPASQDQENLPGSIEKAVTAAATVAASAENGFVKPDPGSTLKPERHRDRIVVHRERGNEKPAPLAPVSTNMPHRPAPPPPPPKMSVLETATSAAGASTTKQKKRRAHFVVNGKIYSQMKRIGKGGSSDVYQVMAENSKMFALKRVKLEGADEAAIAGYKGEIELLKKLEDVDRVVRLIDYQIEEAMHCLYVIMDLGDCDLARIIRVKQDGPPLDSSIGTENSNSAGSAKLDIPFTRYYWQEMLQCVAAVHDHDIVHSDLKPANFLLVQGQLKLIDFGIANMIDIENTVNVHRDSHVGTPNYMSPESLQDSSTASNPTDESVQVSMGKLMKLGKPSDVWSLGCILYQMVYGRPPFAHIPNTIHRVMAIMNPSVSISYPPTGIGGSKVPSELRRTLRRCLNRDPGKRPTVKDLLAEGDEWLHPEDVEGRDLRISEDLLGQIIWNVAKRFRDKSREGPTDEEVGRYAKSFYDKIREWAEE